MDKQFQLVLGTGNQKKKAELVRLLAGSEIDLQSLSDFDPVEEPEENGSTFAENAAIKARYYAAQFNRWTLAEDSGLCVEALGGEPGIYSARFSGPQANDESNNQMLLEKLADVAAGKRAAWYNCHICVVDPNGTIQAESCGQVHGRILSSRRGAGGFGYDPLFELPEYDMTFAELGSSVKSVLSHRGRAYRQLLPRLISITRCAATT